ncbi:hypothetical protein [Actinomadura chibensis]|uniref:Uncharacterized protein n=1 Tax=Actinomadura chibensis TaxID=392828 RepID=A0A5D0NWD8_9ACTN|nr:hypothetical protein [Actinomadura chibensis]TYB48993.1 hypothetical protein FXF69_07560 [Actinomadura chibensis]
MKPTAAQPTSAETDTLALLLFTAWAARTGRAIPAGPVAELTPEEIIEFWVDDHLEAPYTGSANGEDA